MSYSYATQKRKLFTEEGQKGFLAIRDRVKDLLTKAGAVMMQQAITSVVGGPSDSWAQIACLDRMVELGELYEMQSPNGKPMMGQHRVFVSGSFAPPKPR